MAAADLDTFHQHVAECEARAGYQAPQAFALGIATLAVCHPLAPATIAEDAKVLDTYYPVVNLNENHASAAVLAAIVGHTTGTASYRLSAAQVDEALAVFAPFLNDGRHHGNILALKAAHRVFQSDTSALTAKPRVVVVSFIGDITAEAPCDVHDAYLRLHLLSHCKVRPHGVNLDGLFGILNNVVWTNHGPYDPDQFDCQRSILRAEGIDIQVTSIDKFPRMTDYVIPPGVRIADADRVRLGAHLASGTTVMHEGFCNFNAGTLGHSMIEGRISAGVVVGDGSDLGGGSSIMGTLSGGGTEVITIGEGSLVGANAGLGIPLGNNCTIESGLYITAGSKVLCLWDETVRKARELAGVHELLFRRNSQSGAIEVLRKRNQVVLNEALHKNA